MPALGSRDDLTNYCLRKLGAPVIRIDVAQEQIDDRIDEALQIYSEYHFNGTLRTYYRYEITPTDFQNQYITLPDNIIGAVDIFPMQGFVISGGDIFDIRYQVALNDLYTLTGTDLVPYTMTMTHLNTMNELLIGRTPIRYNRRAGNNLYIDTNWSQMPPGTWIVVECFQMIDPDDFEGIYDDIWLKKHVTALIKEQWGTNLSKFQGQPLPGGMVLNGDRILQQAQAEIEKSLDDLRTMYTLPPLDRMA